jgi:gliding motility-associated lipoprotein GldD
MRTNFFLVLGVIITLAACRPEEYTPKRRGYSRIDTPLHHQYQIFAQEGFPYSFEYPTYANITKDTLIFEKTPDNPYWININFPGTGGTIYLSYKNINSQQNLEKLLEDAHFMSFYHTKKADYQNDFSFRNEFGVQGYLYEWGGDAASKYQFVATDSTHHFVRGALYFNCTPNADSLKPLNDFMRTDIQHLLKTIRWK